jgi:transposase
MALRKGMRVDRGYATVADDEGDNYREIADMMTEMGFSMNHSSARNYVLRVMRKFAHALTEEWQLNFDDQRIDEIAKSPQFQHGIADLLHVVEAQRRARKVIVSKGS